MTTRAATVLQVGAAMGFALVAGYVAIVGELKLIGLFIAAIAGLVVAAFPTFLLWIGLLVGLIISGLTRLYLPPLEQVRWLIIPVGFLLVGHAFLQRLSLQTPAVGIPAIIWWVIAFIVVAVITSLVNGPDVNTVLVGLKGYFQVYGLLFGLAFVKWPDRVIEQLPKFFLWLAFLQLPFVLHQYFFVVPTRYGIQGIVPVDIVAGTFGASWLGGGANSVLAAFMISVLACLVALWQQNELSVSRLLLYTSLLFWPVLLTESKISIVYLMVAFFLLFGRDVIERPARFILGVAGFGLVFVIVMTSFVSHAPSGQKLTGYGDLIRFTYEANVERSTNFSGLTRFGSVKYWWNNGTDDFFGLLLGHGAGVTRVEADPSVPTDDPNVIDPALKIGRVAAVAILWEFGVIGLVCVLGMFAAAFRTAGRLVKHYATDRRQTAFLRGIQVTLAILLVSVLEKKFFAFHVGFQTFLVVVFGYLAYLDYRTRIEEQNSHRSSIQS